MLQLFLFLLHLSSSSPPLLFLFSSSSLPLLFLTSHSQSISTLICLYPYTLCFASQTSHFCQWTTMLFPSKTFYGSDTPPYPSGNINANVSEDEDEINSQSSAPAFLPIVRQRRRTRPDIDIGETTEDIIPRPESAPALIGTNLNRKDEGEEEDRSWDIGPAPQTQPIDPATTEAITSFTSAASTDISTTSQQFKKPKRGKTKQLKKLVALFKKKAMRELEEQRPSQQQDGEVGTQPSFSGKRHLNSVAVEKMKDSTKATKIIKKTMEAVSRQMEKGVVDKQEVQLDETEEKVDEPRERPINKGNRAETVFEEPKVNTLISIPQPNMAPSSDLSQPHESNINVEGKGTGDRLDTLAQVATNISTLNLDIEFIPEDTSTIMSGRVDDNKDDLACLKIDESPAFGKLQEDITEQNDTTTPSSPHDESKTESQKSTEPVVPQAPKKSKGQRRREAARAKKIAEESEQEKRRLIPEFQLRQRPTNQVAQVFYKNSVPEIPFYRAEVVPGRTHKQLFANRFIPRGKTFLWEPPLITLSDCFTTKEAEEAYASCTSDIKTRINALTNARPEMGLYGRMSTNMIPLGNMGRVGVFEKIPQVTYSCEANVRFLWAQDRFLGFLVAIVDIPEGQKLSVRLQYAFHTSSIRREKISQINGTPCTCHLCSLPPLFLHHSDENRLAYHRLLASYPIISSSEPLSALFQIEKTIELIILEGLWEALFDRFVDGFEICVRWADAESAAEWAEAARDAAMLCQGDLFGDSEFKMRFTRDPERYDGWGKFGRTKLRGPAEGILKAAIGNYDFEAAQTQARVDRAARRAHIAAMSSRVQPSSSDVPSQPLIDNTLPIDALVAAIEGKGEGEEGEGR
ncbi:hypothetical protein C370_06372 [Cryptococcus neoformans A1-35-8]|nr:hypothetical protein C369_06304 [Cryptococcus neoformans var. grubii A5-35-17]OXH03898.1 hypothetical protein C370_06372 [Cryptococcus neoformans var. grubii A1-35-8]